MSRLTFTALVKRADFAHLAGKMMPPLFGLELSEPGNPRWRGSFVSMWFWMHACGCKNGLARSFRVGHRYRADAARAAG
jgi:hypothetical protein